MRRAPQRATARAAPGAHARRRLLAVVGAAMLGACAQSPSAPAMAGPATGREGIAPPQEGAEAATPRARLTNTYWRLTHVDGQPVAVADGDGEREPHMVLADVDGQRDARAVWGCNQIGGRHAVQGETLQLAWTRATRMACRPPLDRQEAQLQQRLSGTLGWRIEGQRLRLLAADGTVLAEFEAVALP